ncbi:MAG: DUF2892 domain-containing protein [Bacillota bacterium]|nr:DUF2892 domain-containing protein [Bacillota bacterium]
MKVAPNIGILNALIRITVGLTILSWITAKLVKRPWRDSYLIMAMLGAMKVAEGIVRFCPLTALYKMCPISDQAKNNNDISIDEEQILPYSPS